MIITHNSRSAVSEIFGFIQLAYLHYFNDTLPINYETPSFEAVKYRRPLPKGWNGTINAEPRLLLKRGFDKVIHVSRNLIDLCKSIAKYHTNAQTIEDYIKLAIKRPKFFYNINKKREILERNHISDPKFLKITLADWNKFTLETFNKLLDFLEFPTENRPFLIPVKFTEEQRDFEGYSCSHLPKDYIVNDNIQKIRGT